MSQRVALVTGANKSIGLAAVRAFARQGMVVYLGSRDEAAGKRAADEAKADGDIRPVWLDVTKWDSLEAAISRIAAEQGKLDVLVNNAGIAPDDSGPAEADINQARMVMETNTFGPARLIQLALPLLRKSDAARIVNVSSEAGCIGRTADGTLQMGPFKPFGYCLSKAALNSVTALFADQLRDEGIKVNACSPGFVNSALSRFMGTKTPEDGAQIIVKLANDGADGPTGGFFTDSGSTAW